MIIYLNVSTYHRRVVLRFSSTCLFGGAQTSLVTDHLFTYYLLCGRGTAIDSYRVNTHRHTAAVCLCVFTR